MSGLDVIILDSILTCPHCGHRQAERMPEDACLYFWDCPACGAVLKPRPGDCCVFCSYGSAPCPPRQRADDSPAGGQCC